MQQDRDPSPRLVASPLASPGHPGPRGRATTQAVFFALALNVLGVLPAIGADADELPAVPPGFHVECIAREPLVRNPVSMAFDARGRLLVGQGPQFRNPEPGTPGDAVHILVDEDGDGVLDRSKTFAAGFNCIQSLAWRGSDLWVANAPDLTVVTDLDGDDVADRYVRVYTDLGNLEHGLHGLRWAPDGHLWMSKGNSKGLTRPGRVAPAPFRELWGVRAFDGAPDLPPARVSGASDYERAYHDPRDDWGREGGVLRASDEGRGLEIIARGFRNPWDLAFDDSFRWLGTDNDQTGGDKIFSPFRGAHFGWGHPWAADWIAESHPATVGASGPFFEGSGTGIVWCESDAFPATHRGVFLANDWLLGKTYCLRPGWRGSHRVIEGDALEVFASADGALYRPTDLEIGPDGALWVLGWGRGYGVEWEGEGEARRQANEGRVFRITHPGTTASAVGADARRRERTRVAAGPSTASVKELCAQLGGPIDVWRVDAQDELVRRGSAVREELLAFALDRETGGSSRTWSLWALGRQDLDDRELEALFEGLARSEILEIRIHALRILGERLARRGGGALPDLVRDALGSSEPRERFAALEAIASARDASALDALLARCDLERDVTIRFLGFQVLRNLVDRDARRALLADSRPGVRRAALLGLLEDSALEEDLVAAFIDGERDEEVREVALDWLERVSGESRHPVRVDPPGGIFADVIRLELREDGPSIAGAEIRYTLDGSPPNARSPVFRAPIEIAASTVVTAARFRGETRIGSVARAEFRRLASGDAEVRTRVARASLRGGRSLPVLPDAVRVGALAYIDRPYRFTQVPDALRGAAIILTPNDEAGSRGAGLLELEALDEIEVLVAHDERIERAPEWLREWEPTGETVSTDDTRFRLSSRRFPRGPVRLGGNTVDGVERGRSMYLVLVRPAPLERIGPAPTLDEVLALLPQGDARRGELVFFGPANCSGCHRVGDRGQSRAPDLSAAGDRLSAEETARSILLPSERIVEGFRAQVFVMRDGSVHTGSVLSESAIAVRLLGGDLRETSLDLSRVVRRDSTEDSTMPALGEWLGAARIADLVAFLRAQRAPAPGEPGRTPRLAVEERADGFAVRADAVELLRFSRGDELTTRPYLANLRTLEGAAVTRPRPIGATDASDHEHMHPGVWLAFGDLDGEDTWRLRAPVRFEKYLEPPRAEGGSVRAIASFSHLSSDRARVVCNEILELRVVPEVDGYRVECSSEFSSSEASFAFGDQEEMGFGIRLARLLVEKNGGTMRSSTGGVGARATWGQLADWCDSSATIDGRELGVTLFALEGNPRPSWWHNRDYGVMVANLFGREAMRQGAKSRLEIARGDTVRLRYALRVHHGLAGSYDPAKAWRAFSRGSASPAPR